MNGQKRDFDKDAAAWDQNPIRVKLAQDVAKAIIEATHIDNSIEAMDFGCGTGLLTTILSPLVKFITGIDNSEGMLNGLKMKIDHLQLNNVDPRIMNIDQAGSFDKHYNLIVTNMTMHHIENIEKLLKMFYNALYANGSLCIADLDEEQGLFHENNMGVFHFGFNREHLKKLLDQTGFKQIEIKTAAKITKPVKPDSQLREFTIFLITGKKIVS